MFVFCYWSKWFDSMWMNEMHFFSLKSYFVWVDFNPNTFRKTYLCFSEWVFRKMTNRNREWQLVATIGLLMSENSHRYKQLICYQSYWLHCLQSEIQLHASMITLKRDHINILVLHAAFDTFFQSTQIQLLLLSSKDLQYVEIFS